MTAVSPTQLSIKKLHLLAYPTRTHDDNDFSWENPLFSLVPLQEILSRHVCFKVQSTNHKCHVINIWNVICRRKYLVIENNRHKGEKGLWLLRVFSIFMLNIIYYETDVIYFKYLSSLVVEKYGYLFIQWQESNKLSLVSRLAGWITVVKVAFVLSHSLLKIPIHSLR